MFGITDYAKKRKEATDAEARIATARELSARRAEDSKAYLQPQLREAQNPNANAEANERRALLEKHRARQREILSRFGEKEE